FGCLPFCSSSVTCILPRPEVAFHSEVRATIGIRVNKNDKAHVLNFLASRVFQSRFRSKNAISSRPPSHQSPYGLPADFRRCIRGTSPGIKTRGLLRRVRKKRSNDFDARRN